MIGVAIREFPLQTGFADYMLYVDRFESERFRCFTYEDLVARDKASLDIFWLKDDSLKDSENLPDPDVLALEIVENLEAALEQFRGIVADLGEE